MLLTSHWTLPPSAGAGQSHPTRACIRPNAPHRSTGPPVACHVDGTTVLPRGWDHRGVSVSIVDLGGGVKGDALVAVALAV